MNRPRGDPIRRPQPIHIPRGDPINRAQPIRRPRGDRIRRPRGGDGHNPEDTRNGTRGEETDTSRGARDRWPRDVARANGHKFHGRRPRGWVRGGQFNDHMFHGRRPNLFGKKPRRVKLSLRNYLDVDRVHVVHSSMPGGGGVRCVWGVRGGSKVMCACVRKGEVVGRQGERWAW